MGIPSSGGDGGRPEGWRKQIASRLILVLASTLLMLLLLEALARIFVTDPRGLFSVSPQLGYAMVPHFNGKHGKFGQFKVRIETNSKGLRDREFSAKGERQRILVLGDSVSFGWGVEAEQAFPRQLESLQAARTARLPFEVVNAGVWGYNTLQETEYVEAGAGGYQPDLVLVGFTSPVTIERNWKCLQSGVITVEPMSEPRSARRFLKAHSNLFSFLERQWAYQGRLYLMVLGALQKVGLARESASLAGDPARSRPHPLALKVTDPDAVASASVDLLKTLEKSIAAMGARMVVVVFPAAPALADTLASNTPESMERKLTRILTEKLDHAGIETLDLTAPLAELSRSQPIYLPHDTVHFNAAGHKKSAELIRDFLGR
jgi:lysophospholipase L1-like esterase